MGNKPIRIVIVEDLQIVADGLAALLNSEMRPEAKLIFLTRDDSYAAQLAAVEVGACAFIHKSKAAADLLDAVQVT